MTERLTINDGLRIGRQELTLLQSQMAANIARLVSFAALVPTSGGVLTTVSTAGVLGSALRVDLPGGVPTVRAGSGLTGSYAYLSLPADSTTISGSFPVSTNRKVILSQTVTTLEAGTASIAADGVTLTFTGITATALAALYTVGGAIRLSGSAAGNNGTFRIYSISNLTIVLGAATGGVAESGLSHSVAGVFFAGYPLSPNTTDIMGHDGVALSYQDPATYVNGPLDLQLATLTKSAGGTISLVTDDRQVITPQMQGFQITDANIAASAAISESKIALSTGLQNAKTQTHAQNTDTYTTSPTFRVGGVSGPRVLTTLDTQRVEPRDPVASLNPEVNVNASFYDGYFGATVPNQSRVPLLKITWGITGTAGSATGQTLTITADHSLTSNLAANALTNFLLRDSTGAVYAIASNTAATAAVNGTGATSFTVTVVSGTPTGGGTYFIHTNATSYRVSIIRLSDRLTSSYDVAPDVSGYMPLNGQATLIGTPGALYNIQLTALNKTLGNFSTVTLANVTWGTSNITPVSSLNVTPSSISVAADSSRVLFSWSHPTGFNTATMNYQIAVTEDGSTPTTFDRLANSNATQGYMSFYTPSYGLVKILIRVIDLSGTVLSTVNASAQGTAINSLLSGTLQTELLTFSLQDSDFVDIGLGAGTPTKKLRTKLFLQNVVIVGIAVSVQTLTGTGGLSIKGAAWQTGIPSNVVYGSVLSTLGDFLTPVSTLTFGNSLDIGIEKSAGTVTGTGVVGNILIYYRETGGTVTPGSGAGGTTRGGGSVTVAPVVY